MSERALAPERRGPSSGAAPASQEALREEVLEGGGGRPAATVALEVIDFASVFAAAAWRGQLRAVMRPFAGLRFARALSTLGSAASGGFSPGRPAPGRQVLLTVWSDPAGLRGYVKAMPIAEAFRGSRHAWRVLLEPLRGSGSFGGVNPFTLAPATQAASGAFAALTLGRSRAPSLGRFVREGAGLAQKIAEAPGLVTALSAGLPLTGNATFSVWRSEEEMLWFAYGPDPAGHSATVRADRTRPILAEQLNARLRVLCISGHWDPRGTLHADALQRVAAELSAGVKKDTLPTG